jgi:phospholipase C
MKKHWRVVASSIFALGVVLLSVQLFFASANTSVSTSAKTTPANEAKTTTPIKHVVVLFQENVSFDHYFATYPNATNPAGEPAFHASS